MSKLNKIKTEESLVLMQEEAVVSLKKTILGLKLQVEQAEIQINDLITQNSELRLKLKENGY